MTTPAQWLELRAIAEGVVQEEVKDIPKMTLGRIADRIANQVSVQFLQTGTIKKEITHDD